MAEATHFLQACPTCGRNLQVPVAYHGRRVVCQHCGGKFVAQDESAIDYSPPSLSDSALYRAEQLLERIERSGILQAGRAAEPT